MLQSAQVLEAELAKHTAANAGIERDVARFKERETIVQKVRCSSTRFSGRQPSLSAGGSDRHCSSWYLPPADGLLD